MILHLYYFITSLKRKKLVIPFHRAYLKHTLGRYFQGIYLKGMYITYFAYRLPYKQKLYIFCIINNQLESCKNKFIIIGDIRYE